MSDAGVRNSERIKELEKKLHESNMRSAPEIEKKLSIAIGALEYISNKTDDSLAEEIADEALRSLKK